MEVMISMRQQGSSAVARPRRGAAVASVERSCSLPEERRRMRQRHLWPPRLIAARAHTNWQERWRTRPEWAAPTCVLVAGGGAPSGPVRFGYARAPWTAATA